MTQAKYNLYPQVPKVYVSDNHPEPSTFNQNQENQQPTKQGGYQVFSSSEISALLDATYIFSSTNTDPKASIITTLNVLSGIPEAVLLTFYDGPHPPPSFLDAFATIPALYTDISTRSFSSLTSAAPSGVTAGTRGAFHTLSTTGLTRGFLAAVHNETLFYGVLAGLHTGVFVSYDIEPFLSNYGSHAAATDTAYPHHHSPIPLELYFAWLLPVEDALWRSRIQDSVDYLMEVAKREGIFVSNLTAYPNYALGTYKGEQLFGVENAERLRRIKKEVDPGRVMDLTGGFVL